MVWAAPSTMHHTRQEHDASHAPGGNGHEKWLLSRLQLPVNWRKFNAGTKPVKSLVPTWKWNNRLSRVNDCGMLPLKWLTPMSKYCKAVSCDMDDGIEPL